jgi:hypothetical protein
LAQADERLGGTCVDNKLKVGRESV